MTNRHSNHWVEPLPDPWKIPAPVPAADVVAVKVPGFGDKKSYHLHDVAYRRTLSISDAVQSIQQGFSQTTVWLDPDKVRGLTDLEKLVLADGQPSPFGGVVAGNQVTIYRD